MIKNAFSLGALALSLVIVGCSPAITAADVVDTGAQGSDAQNDAAVVPMDVTTPPVDASTGPVGSCAQMVGTLAYCVDYTGTEVTSDAVRMVCTAQTGTYSATNCLTAMRVGRCTLEGATAAITQTASYYSPTTAQEAMTACTGAGGTFVAD
ncbi:MAG: hypothetical protein WCJ30_02325 [Deltaproteobacteria bacterium]